MMNDIGFTFYYWKMTIDRLWNEIVKRRKVRGYCSLSGDWAYMDHDPCEICQCDGK